MSRHTNVIDEVDVKKGHDGRSFILTHGLLRITARRVAPRDWAVENIAANNVRLLSSMGLPKGLYLGNLNYVPYITALEDAYKTLDANTVKRRELQDRLASAEAEVAKVRDELGSL